MSEIDVGRLLDKIKKEIKANDPNISDDELDKKARDFLQFTVKLDASSDGQIIGIGGEVFSFGGLSIDVDATPIAETKDMDVSPISGSANNSELSSDDRQLSANDQPSPEEQMPEEQMPEEQKPELSPEDRKKLDRVLVKVDEYVPPVDSVRLRVSRGNATVFDSKMGGVPYLPKGMKYPTVHSGKNKGKPLYFLAQLNFGKLPHIDGFPTEGILQFYAGCDHDDDYMIGMNFDDRCDRNAFRVIYHEKVDESGKQGTLPKFEDDEPYFPVKEELLLTADAPEKTFVTSSDFRFEKAFVAAYNEVCNTDMKSIWGKGGLFEAEEALCNAAFDERNTQGTRIGGFPFFMQGEPRERYPDHTVLLFQSDSEWDGSDYCVSWGDCGVANFFIKPEDLKNRDFSNVMYNWDCG